MTASDDPGFLAAEWNAAADRVGGDDYAAAVDQLARYIAPGAADTDRRTDTGDEDQ